MTRYGKNRVFGPFSEFFSQKSKKMAKIENLTKIAKNEQKF